jgi:2-dehydropantoate 2-reductase
MRQVPTYAIIGRGRVATHFCHYLQSLSLPFHQWYRPQDLESLAQIIKKSSHVLVLTSDHAIEKIVDDIQPLIDDQLVMHFSGSLVLEHCYAAHPLMTFGETLYDEALYRQIPFIVSEQAPPFSELLPGLENPHYQLADTLRPLYHAYCVIANNFSSIVWRKAQSEFERRLQLPKETLNLIAEQTFKNLIQHPDGALTGPLVRGDMNTIDANLTALEGDPFQKVYQAFVQAFQQETIE